MATLISRHRSDCYDSGNNMTRFYEEHYRCDECNGKGEIKVDRQTFLNHLHGRFDGMDEIFNEALSAYHLWKNFRVIECPECNGVGEWCEIN